MSVVNREKLEKLGYGNAAIESLEFGLPIAIWRHFTEEAKEIELKYKDQYEAFFIREFPNGYRYLYGSIDRTKIASDLLEELPKAER